MLPFTKTQLNSASDVAETYKVRFAKLFSFFSYSVLFVSLNTRFGYLLGTYTSTTEYTV